MVGYDVIERNGYDPIDYEVEIEAVNVRVIGSNPLSGHVFLDEEYDPEDWTCLQEFLDDLRHRLIEFVDTELSEIVEGRVQDILKRERGTRIIADYFEGAEEFRVPSEETLAASWLRDIMGLERDRPRVSVSNIARTRLRASDSDAKKHRVREARAIIKMTRSKK